MTLIARFSIREAPIVVGDVLLSSERKTGLRTNLPLVGDINQILANQGLRFEVSFAQKVNILSDRLVVAWAGPMDQAERALRVLSNATSSGQITNKYDIARELEAIDPEKVDKVQLVGMLIIDVSGDQITGSPFSWRVSNTEVTGIGTVHAAGSGKEEFIRLLAKTDWTLGGTANEHQVAHSILAALVNMEYRQGGTIVNRWGGGFEAVTFSLDSGRFQKVGDILHTFWKADTCKPDEVLVTPMYYKTAYWRDALVVRSARFDVHADSTFHLAENSLELIPPLLKDVGEYDLEELGSVDFSHKVLCCHVSIERPGGRSVMHVIQQSQPNATIDLQFNNIDSSGRLHIPGELSKMVIEEARTRASQIVEKC
jgi:hypothetical protein